MTHGASRHDRERGFTLVELLVTTALLSLVLVAVGSIFVSLINTERRVTSVTQSTTDAQLLASAIGEPIRNSSGFQVTAGPSGTDDQLLVARVAGAEREITWRCQAFYYSESRAALFTRTGPDGTAIPLPSVTDLGSWTLIAEGVQPRAGLPVFEAGGRRLAVAFEVAGDRGDPTRIETTAVRLTGIEESGSCW